MIGSEILRAILHDVALTRSLDEAVDHVMNGFATLSLHPDIADGIRDLKKAGLRLVTLSNGSAQVAESLLARAGLRSEFESLLTVEDAPAWKPVRSADDYAADVCGVQPADLLLVAVHPWDIHGAAQAGFRTAWLNRADEIYPSYFAEPDHIISALGGLATQLAHYAPGTTHEDWDSAHRGLRQLERSREWERCGGLSRSGNTWRPSSARPGTCVL
ncbi:2-haloacid dehalogenase [Cryobacterium sp. MP_M5]|uniref:HAD family hydrolase n=1 Tax=unclassified Cryobacterium TaxID=2649013 RepID=UPI0018CA8CDD|nr:MULTISPECIES: HAD family hydrolase [unclassified Cryobacterium]MBG6058210.1 2-haloacid dehalogenase [Cryobacterium sp. MP_M3]MEC5176544.1 2-haloacid dehalogenase [Cryobacterium sp. MP_M5]